MNDKSIVTVETNRQVMVNDINEEQIQIIKDTICKGATDSELKFFIQVCKKTGLDPLTRQIYSISRWDKQAGKEIRTIQTSIDGFRVIAERSNQYGGQDGPYWCDKSGVWSDVWIHDYPPTACKVGVIRHGFDKPLYAVARFNDYAQKNRDGSLGKFWQAMPSLMIAKVAEALALRKAFPNDLSGIYTSDEMAQADISDLSKPQPPTVKEKPIVIESKEEREKIIVIESLKKICATKTAGFTIDEKKQFVLEVLGFENFNSVYNLTLEQTKALFLKVSGFTKKEEIKPEQPIDTSFDFVTHPEPEQMNMENVSTFDDSDDAINNFINKYK